MTDIWVKTTAEDIKPGDEIRAIERYGADGTLTYEGTVEIVGTRVIDFKGNMPGIYREDQNGVGVQLYRRPPALPITVGAIVKYYDPSYLTHRAAVRGPDRWYVETGEGGWEIREEEILQNFVAVLFDPRDG